MNSLHSSGYSCLRILLFTVCLIINILALGGEVNDFGFKDEDGINSVLCECDMTGGRCDVYCCCDEDCSEEASSAFTCDTDMHSDGSTWLLRDWKCDNIDLEQGFHFGSFLCIEKANSPYLGHYFPVPKDVKDLPSLNSLLSKQRNDGKVDAFPDLPNENEIGPPRVSSGYIFGQNLEVQIASSLGYREIKFLFPYNVYNARCDLIYPVSFLKDVDSTCSTKIRSTTDFFHPNSLFNVSTFLIGNFSKKSLLSFPGNKTLFTNVGITYQQAANLCCYLSSTTCTFSAACTKNVIPFHSSFHDGPICDNSLCKNIVLEVAYHFFWKGPKIVWLNITFTLGDVPFIDGQGHSGKAFSAFLTQHFSATYIYVPFINASDVILDHTPSVRSGKYGYEIGLPLLGSTLFQNDSYIEQDSPGGNKTYFYIPKYDVFRKCTSQRVNFGQDIFSGCQFYLKLNDFSNCSNLRLHILDIQSQVLQVSMISKYGDPDFQNAEDFLDVLEEEEFPQNTSSEDNVIEELPWQPRISSCNNMPDHVQLHVLYTDVDTIRDQPVYRVIGAIRRYEKNTWNAPCAQTEICHENESFAFPLTAAVHFSFISSEKNRKVKRFWASSIPVTQCKEETCWDDIFYPLLPSFTLNHVISTANNCFLLLLFLLPFAWLKIRHA